MTLDYHKWLFQYKLLHIFLWSMVVVFALLTFGGQVLPWEEKILVAIFSVGMNIFPFYYSAYRLVPNFLYKQQFLWFVASILLLVLFNATAGFFLIRTAYYLTMDDPILPPMDVVAQNLNMLVWNTFIAISVGCGLKILLDRFRMERQLLQAEKDKITTELNFLRSQTNPHFLFNVLNTIYFQIDQKNAQARATVEKLSEILRYQLYECTTDKIEIAKEVDYIKSYVAIQTLRMEKGSDIQLWVDEQMGHFRIAPLLILPLIENAFKHVSHFAEPSKNRIHISLQREDPQYLVVQATNTYDRAGSLNTLSQPGGLGVQNLKRRLELLYPQRHQLQIAQHDNVFQTTLKLPCDD